MPSKATAVVAAAIRQIEARTPLSLGKFPASMAVIIRLFNNGRSRGVSDSASETKP
jgi:hypothetical protein